MQSCGITLLAASTAVSPAPVWGGSASLATKSGAQTAEIGIRLNTTPIGGVIYQNGKTQTQVVFSYFNVPAADVNVAEYEVQAQVTATSGGNLSSKPGTSPFNTWITLQSGVPVEFALIATGYNSGSASIAITIRHKNDTSMSASRSFVLSKLAGYPAPSFSPNQATLAVAVFAAESFIVGVYFDSASSANSFQVRSYRNGVLYETQTIWFYTAGLDESGYTVEVTGAYTHQQGSMSAGGWLGGVISNLRAGPPNIYNGYYFYGDGSTQAGNGFMTIRIYPTTEPSEWSEFTLTAIKQV